MLYSSTIYNLQPTAYIDLPKTIDQDDKLNSLKFYTTTIMVARGFPRCKLNYVNIIKTSIKNYFKRIINFENNKYANSGKSVRLFTPDVLSP